MLVLAVVDEGDELAEDVCDGVPALLAAVELVGFVVLPEGATGPGLCAPSSPHAAVKRPAATTVRKVE